MKHITTTRAAKGDHRPLNYRRREASQKPAWITLAGILALIAAIYYSTP